MMMNLEQVAALVPLLCLLKNVNKKKRLVTGASFQRDRKPLQSRKIEHRSGANETFMSTGAQT
ncbi:hypothetical protein BAE31_16320 [Bacillus sp. I-2]|nr:hypothetical protein B4107_0841 [Bacillus safensis]MBW0258417.1 hypothetical protein [Bacillus sp. F2HM]OMP29509.1 hypothetical protein BAE31_16320 [Bacillus sp. I-2]